MHEFRVRQTEYFGRLVKELRKKYRKVEKDIDSFLSGIHEVTDLGTSPGNNLYKELDEIVLKSFRQP